MNMKSYRFPAILLTLTLLITAVLMPSGLADTGPQFAGSWYAVSFVLDGTEYFPETWDQDLVLTLGADGRFFWSGKFYDDYQGTWSTLSSTEIQLLPDDEDGTPGAEEDAFSLNLNQDKCLIYVEEDGPTIAFADHLPEKPVRPEIIREENADQYSGEWILERILVAEFFVTPEQFAVLTGTEITSSIVLDGLDAYPALSSNLSSGFTLQLKMKCDDGSLVQAQNDQGIYLRKVSLTDIGMLAVEFCTDGSGEDPLMFYYTKAE